MQSAKEKKVKETNSVPRPPVVVIMGHIDHGKTTLLDFIRSSNVAAKESGSITQHIGAYEVEHNGKRITFLDTPGHESFSRMRARGARVADVAVLVVAADDGVKPQTTEAVRAARDVGIPFLVAINKMDKPEADANRVKGDLAEHEVLVEGWGGNVPVAEISARTGAGVPELMDLILLQADMEELAASPDVPGSGVVIESYRDRQRGVVATLLIKNGTVRRGDWLASGTVVGSIRIMEDSSGTAVPQASFASPIRVLGFSNPPHIGDLFMTYPDKQAAQAAAQVADAATDSMVAERPADSIEVSLIIKADVAGSREALEQEIEKLAVLPLAVRILRSDIGDISEDDIKAVADVPSALIVGFRVRVHASAALLAERYGITIHISEIIYELLDWLEGEFVKRIPVQTERIDEGNLKILKVFKRDGKKHVFGGIVTQGVIKNGALFEIMRAGAVAGKGVVTNLQENKIDANEVGVNKQCGLAADVEGKLDVGDSIVTYSEHKVR